MKHAINELQALLDTWTHRDDEWKEDLGKAVAVLQAIDNGAVVAIDPAFEHQANMAQTTIEEKVAGVVPVEAHPYNPNYGPVGEKPTTEADQEVWDELDPSKACGSNGETCEACQ